MWVRWLLLVAVSVAPLSALSQSTMLPESGIPLALARSRATLVADLHYEVSGTIGAAADALRGSVRLRFTLSRAAEVVLDYRPAAGHGARDWRVNGVAVAPAAENDHVVLRAVWLKAGVNEVEMAFSAPIGTAGTAITRHVDKEDGAAYVYSLFVPADASSVFPCFDQPDLKARFTLALSVPRNWQVVSNGVATGRADAIDGVRHTFAPTRALPTYLFAFAAGPFAALEEPGIDGGTRLFVRRSQLARAQRESAGVLKLSRESNDFFARYFDHPFPFDKHDLVLLPEFPYGGMEHAGAVFLREDAVLFRAPPTAADRLRRANLILHENAHQWFGNLVTMRWFDDLWLKEGFANFAAAKAIEALLPEFDAWNALRASKLAAYRTDATAGTTPIHQPLPNLADAKSAYGAIVYTKAPAVLRQAEFYLGAPVFERAVRALVRDQAYGNAAWSDLVRAFEAASGRDLRSWAEAWVERRGLATVRVRRPDQRDAAYKVTQAPVLPEGGVWPMRIELAFVGNDGAMTRQAVTLDHLEAGFPAPPGATPAVIVPNAGDFGYARFLLDPASAERVLGAPALIRDNLTRALAFDALWEMVRDADLAPERYLRFAIAALPGEADAITAAGLYGRIAHAFRTWLSDTQRNAVAPMVEAALTARMRGAATPGERLQAMRTLAQCAWSDNGLTTLIALLDGTERAGDTPLAPRDRFALIERLLLRGHPQAAMRLAAEASRPAGEDTAVFAFAAGAAVADAAVKARYLERFLADSNLAEDWIEQALPVLNATEHAALTTPLLARALAALPVLKRRHKIFFIGAWLGAFVGAQQEAGALAAAHAAAADTALEPDLRLKLLENLDALERTVRIRARFAAG
jgi:aminopeptidase N